MNQNDERERAERLGAFTGAAFTGHPVIGLLILWFGFRNTMIGIVCAIIGLIILGKLSP
jgi:hypothetical protein